MSEAATTPKAPEDRPDYTKIVPRDAASLIILDHTLTGPYVLMGKRHERHVFMPGAYVFPGGRLEACDSEMVVAGALHPAAEHKLMLQVEDPSPLTARALALAAIRETFEETGHLIGSTDYGAPEETPAEWHAFAEHGVFPELDGLHFVARAITPPRYPRRFDARFFVTEASSIARTVEGAHGPDHELVELVWVRLDDAASLNTPTITRMVMAELALRLAEGFRQEAPVPLFRNDTPNPRDEL
ncbi:8-oxo-dGTP pyrophosphatase MutT (NUDIX family) [Pseudochelatococcus lubricantis]|uniref:8-oxo-dGTP pyrophosphatase MutT (NUDIX family) n=1 Tax=Pseudochelatococcus lubricantis TaxID=1538102 RepID=A0ABX0UTQ0_9HYPH|nr:NUDIX domain-containing protein [Pseudochelatococcus lubricantis]NIJ56336.1 8-oxo-dGTP pyrophosphatase MutT (NUDIX family) [Pseudochelatococcus lubricantis]